MILISDKVLELLNKLSMFSPATYEHCVNVSKIAASFAHEIGLDEEKIEKLKIMGLLHDIGKLKVPEKILHKPGKLSKEEYEVVKNHTKYGVELLTNIGFSDSEVIYSILHHHERIDGLGYPSGLKGDLIPELVKILVICDSYDAMHSRHYNENHDMEYIKNEFIKNSGTQFDSYYTKLFLDYLDRIIQKSK